MDWLDVLIALIIVLALAESFWHHSQLPTYKQI